MICRKNMVTKRLAHSTRLMVLVVVLTTFCGCFSQCSPDQAPPEYKSIRELPLEERHVRFSQYPTEVQIEVYLYASTALHPQQTDYAYDIARKGRDALGTLNEKLRQETAPLNQQRLFYVYEVMSKFFYPLTNEEETIALLKEVASKMQPPYKESAALSLRYVVDPKLDERMQKQPQE